jgi:hypothetical protein
LKELKDSDQQDDTRNTGNLPISVEDLTNLSSSFFFFMKLTREGDLCDQPFPNKANHFSKKTKTKSSKNIIDSKEIPKSQPDRRSEQGDDPNKVERSVNNSNRVLAIIIIFTI